MGRKGLAIVEVFIVAAIMVAFGWWFASAAGKKPSAPQNARIVVMDNGATDNTLRERR